MGDFIKRLGRFVQGLLDIFRKPKIQEETKYYIVGTNDSNDWVEISKREWDACQEKYKSCVDIINRAKEPVELTVDNAVWDMDLLGKIANTSLTNLPKPIKVRTLLITLAANQEWEGNAVDLSRIEEGIAHYFISSVKTQEELLEQYAEEFDDTDELFVGNYCTAVVGSATLWEWNGEYYVDYD